MNRDQTRRGARPHGACPPADTLAAFACRELDAAARHAVASHLDACPGCRGQVQEFEQTAARVARLPERRPGRDLLPGILAEIEAAERRVRVVPASWRSALRPALALAAALALMYLGSVWMSRPGTAPVSSAAGERVAAVNGALRWLAAAQQENGAWDPARWQGQTEYETSLTAMGLLAFVRAGEAAGAPGERVMRRAAGYLLSMQSDDGAFGPDVPGRMYNHGIATFAMVEAAGRLRDPDIDRAVDRAVGFIAERQHYNGGWGYGGPGTADDVNAGTSIWQLLALASARRAGRAVPAAALNHGLLWLRSVVDAGGRVGYRRQGDFPMGSETLTAMGALCVAMVSPEVSGLDVMRETLAAAVGAAAARQRAEVDFYRSFFISGVLGQSPPEGSSALTGLQATLAGMAVRGGADAGSWEPADTWSAVGGRLYSTAMAVLSLETAPREG